MVDVEAAGDAVAARRHRAYGAPLHAGTASRRSGDPRSRAGIAVLPDLGFQARGNLADVAAPRVGMDRRFCAGALDEPAANQVSGPGGRLPMRLFARGAWGGSIPAGAS